MLVPTRRKQTTLFYPRAYYDVFSTYGYFIIILSNPYSSPLLLFPMIDTYSEKKGLNTSKSFLKKITVK